MCAQQNPGQFKKFLSSKIALFWVFDCKRWMWSCADRLCQLSELSGYLLKASEYVTILMRVQNNLIALPLFLLACSSGKPIWSPHIHSFTDLKKKLTMFEFWRGSHTTFLLWYADKCPPYLTEVVFALDMSDDVTPTAFDRMRNIVMLLLKTISESNCPTGARVSVNSFNTSMHYLIWFSEFQKSNLLLQAVQTIPLERSNRKQNIGAAMRFVARNVFKCVRQGIITRKVALFFASGPSHDDVAMSTAVLELSALDITPVVIAFNEVPDVRRTFSVSRQPVQNWVSHPLAEYLLGLEWILFSGLNSTGTVQSLIRKGYIKHYYFDKEAVIHLSMVITIWPLSEHELSITCALRANQRISITLF